MCWVFCLPFVLLITHIIHELLFSDARRHDVTEGEKLPTLSEEDGDVRVNLKMTDFQIIYSGREIFARLAGVC